jgi:hypothetical protein
MNRGRYDDWFLGLDELFEGQHVGREIIVFCVRWCPRFKISSRDLVEMMAERGLSMTPTTIMRRSSSGAGTGSRGRPEIPGASMRPT